MPKHLRPVIVFNADDGGGGGVAAPPAAPEAPAVPMSPDAAARARIDQAVAGGMRDGDPETGAPPAAEGAPAPEAGDPEFPEVDFDNLTYRDGKRLREQLTAQKDRYKPFEQAFGGLEDADRQAAVEALSGLGAEAAPLLGLVAGMPTQDRNMLLGAYQEFLADPAKGAESFRAIYEAAARSAGIDPAAAPVAPEPAPVAPPPAAGDDDLDRPITMRELQAQQEAARAEAQIEQAQQESQREMLAKVRDLGYDPDSTDPDTRAGADEVIWLAAYRTAGDIDKAHAIVETRRQSIIDGYVNGKRANAQRPAAPETGTATSSATPPGKQDPLAASRARLDAELGPDPHARIS